MDGTVIDYVKYRDGHANLGKQSLRVQIVAFPSNLTVKGLDGKALFSVPWGNFENAHSAPVSKEGLASVGAVVLGSIPILEFFASSFIQGFWLRYWDNDIQRQQDIFFETGSERKADQVVRKIFQYRDQYHRQTRNVSGPQRR